MPAKSTSPRITWKSPLTLLECHERLAEAAIIIHTLAYYSKAHSQRFGSPKRFARDSLAVLTRKSDRVQERSAVSGKVA